MYIFLSVGDRFMDPAKFAVGYKRNMYEQEEWTEY